MTSNREAVIAVPSVRLPPAIAFADKVHTQAALTPVAGANSRLHAAHSLWAFHAVYPLVWVAHYFAEIHARTLSRSRLLCPSIWKWANYREAWVFGNMGRYLSIVFVVTAVSTSSCLRCLDPAFVLGSVRFPVQGLDLGLHSVWVSHSPFDLLVPLAIFTRQIGLYNSLIGLSLVYAAVGIPWNVFFLRASWSRSRAELEEAAVLDGATMWHVFRDVVLPLTTPALATMATFHVSVRLERVHPGSWS